MRNYFAKFLRAIFAIAAATLITIILATLLDISDFSATIIFILILTAIGLYALYIKFNVNSRFRNILKKAFSDVQYFKISYKNVEKLAFIARELFQQQKPFVKMPRRFNSTIITIVCDKCNFELSNKNTNELAQNWVRDKTSAYSECPNCKNTNAKVTVDLRAALQDSSNYQKNDLFYDCVKLVQQIHPEMTRTNGFGILSGSDLTKIDNYEANFEKGAEVIADKYKLSVDKAKEYLMVITNGPRSNWQKPKTNTGKKVETKPDTPKPQKQSRLQQVYCRFSNYLDRNFLIKLNNKDCFQIRLNWADR